LIKSKTNAGRGYGFGADIADFVGCSCMEIQIQVETENLSSEEGQQGPSANSIYLALDKAGKTTEVPQLLLTTEEDSDSSRKESSRTGS
jgi:acyl-CoA hydrolase